LHIGIYITIYLIAAPAIFHWARALNHLNTRA
jgi:hypothetical protein